MKVRSLGTALFFGFGVRAVLAFFNIFVTPLRQSSDAFGYLNKAKALSNYRGDDYFTILLSQDGVITLFGSVVYSVTDHAPIVLGLMMAMLGTGVIYLSYGVANELWGNERVSRIVAWGVALFPQLALHSALFLREIPVSFCLTAAALCAIRFVKHRQVNQVVRYSCWVSFSALFHSGVIVAVPALMVAMWAVRPRASRGNLSFYATNTAAIVILGICLSLVNSNSFGMDKFGGSLEMAVDTFEQKEMRDTTGGAAYPDWLRVRGGLSDIWKVPFRLVALLFSPLIPLMVRTPGHLLGAVDSGLYLYLCWNIYKNWNGLKANRPALVLLIVILALYLLFSLGVSNFGTAIRHRAKMSPILLIVAAGLPELRRQARAYRVYHVLRKSGNAT